MKRVLVGLFYTLQGLIHLWLSLIVRVTGSEGSGAALVGLEIMTRSFLVLASCFSFFTVFFLFLKRKSHALFWGLITSVLFNVFSAIGVMASCSAIASGYNVLYSVAMLLTSLIIMVLNAVSVFGLFSIADEEERMHPYAPKDTYASLIPKGRFCTQCGKLVSVELGSCPNCGKELE
jgi:hypothetical protein